jgi:rare lipoprotein A
MRRLGASVSLLLLASALPASAAGAKHKAADPRPRQRAKNAQHGARVDPHRDPHVAHAASAKGHVSRFRQLGLASWYGRGFHGHRTASGEHYDMYAMTAAHRTLPLGSYVRVTSLASARSVVVRINDRGPYARGRVIDLSYGAAVALGMHRAGVTKVAVERVDKPEVERIAHRQMHLSTHG